MKYIYNGRNCIRLYQWEMSVVCTLFGERETTGMGGCETGRYPLVGPIFGTKYSAVKIDYILSTGCLV